MQWALNNRFPLFDFTWQWVDGADYDVRVVDGTYDNNQLAWVNCPSGATEGGSNPNRWCYGQKLTVNLAFDLPTAGRRYVACHELGHTVGLRHEDEVHSNSCMRLVRDDTPTYSNEDINQVTTAY